MSTSHVLWNSLSSRERTLNPSTLKRFATEPAAKLHESVPVRTNWVIVIWSKPLSQRFPLHQRHIDVTSVEQLQRNYTIRGRKKIVNPSLQLVQLTWFQKFVYSLGMFASDITYACFSQFGLLYLISEHRFTSTHIGLLYLIADCASGGANNVFSAHLIYYFSLFYASNWCPFGFIQWLIRSPFRAK